MIYFGSEVNFKNNDPQEQAQRIMTGYSGLVQQFKINIILKNNKLCLHKTFIHSLQTIGVKT